MTFDFFDFNQTKSNDEGEKTMPKHPNARRLFNARRPQPKPLNRLIVIPAGKAVTIKPNSPDGTSLACFSNARPRWLAMRGGRHVRPGL
jgi:hypothetical protein